LRARSLGGIPRRNVAGGEDFFWEHLGYYLDAGKKTSWGGDVQKDGTLLAPSGPRNVF